MEVGGPWDNFDLILLSDMIEFSGGGGAPWLPDPRMHYTTCSSKETDITSD